jgi:flagellar basal-body rod protein FlgB
MGLSDLPILSMLKSRMLWHEERQRVLSENVSNADTPGYRAKDLSALRFDDQMMSLRPPGVTPPASAVTMVQTASGHMGGSAMSTGSQFRADSKNGYEVRPTGNAVSLEDEMMKVAANQMDYQAATALYSRSLSLLKTAMGKR